MWVADLPLLINRTASASNSGVNDRFARLPVCLQFVSANRGEAQDAASGVGRSISMASAEVQRDGVDQPFRARVVFAAHVPVGRDRQGWQ